MEIKELKVIKQVAPVIQVNFDEMKDFLKSNLAKYEGIIVTEETMDDAKSMQKELSTVRKSIDGIRLDALREAKKPLNEFSEQMKELFGLVVSVEDPIKAGLKVFEDKRIADKNAAINAIIAEKMNASELREKYHDGIIISVKWSNKGASMKSIGEEIDAQINNLKSIQNVRDESETAIRSMCDIQSEKLARPLDADYFIGQLDHGSTLSSILASIADNAKRQSEAEQKAVERASAPRVEDEPPKPHVAPQSANTNESKPDQRTVTIRITTTEAKLLMLRSFMNENLITYEKVEG